MWVALSASNGVTTIGHSFLGIRDEIGVLETNHDLGLMPRLHRSPDPFIQGFPRGQFRYWLPDSVHKTPVLKPDAKLVNS